MRCAVLLLAPLALFVAGCRRPVPPAEEGPVVRVAVEYPGTSASVVVDTIAAPLEQQINGAEGVVCIESESREGKYAAVVRFGTGVEPERALTLVQNRVALAVPVLPVAALQDPGISVKAGTRNLAQGRSLRLALLDRGGDPEQLRRWADAMAKRLVAEGLVSNPVVFPGPDVTRLEMDVDAKRCAAIGVTVDQVQTTVRTFGESTDVQALRKLKVRSSQGQTVPIGAVASFRTRTGPPAAYRVDLFPAIRVSGTPAGGRTAADVLARCLEVAEAERQGLKGATKFEVVDVTGE